MQLAGLILFGVVVAALVLGWVLRRFGSSWGARLSLSAGIVVRIGAGLVLAWTAIRAAAHGGVWYAALAVGLGVIAVATLGLAGVLTWGLIKYGSEVEG